VYVYFAFAYARVCKIFQSLSALGKQPTRNASDHDGYGDGDDSDGDDDDNDDDDSVGPTA